MHVPIASKPELRERFVKKTAALATLDPDRVLDSHGNKPQKLLPDSTEHAGELFNLDRNIGRLAAGGRRVHPARDIEVKLVHERLVDLAAVGTSGSQSINSASKQVITLIR